MEADQDKNKINLVATLGANVRFIMKTAALEMFYSFSGLDSDSIYL